MGLLVEGSWRKGVFESLFLEDRGEAIIQGHILRLSWRPGDRRQTGSAGDIVDHGFYCTFITKSITGRGNCVNGYFDY